MASSAAARQPGRADPMRHHVHYQASTPRLHFLSNSWTGLLNGNGFDPAPFILLNLVFSAVAFYTGALVIIAQKAQTRTDKANEEAAAAHREELAHFQTELPQRNTDLTEQIHELATNLNALTQEVHAATCGRPGGPA
jgi:uncharacterized membrane protein